MKKIDCKLRMRGELRYRIKAAALKRGVSMNAEIVRRLEESFNQDALRTLDGVARDMTRAWRRLGLKLG